MSSAWNFCYLKIFKSCSLNRRHEKSHETLEVLCRHDCVTSENGGKRRRKQVEFALEPESAMSL